MNSIIFNFKTHFSFNPEILENFSVQEIIESTRNVKDNIGTLFFASAMEFIQKTMLDRWIGKKYDKKFEYQPEKIPFCCPNCSSNQKGFTRRGTISRTLKTSIGEMKFKLFRIMCKNCQKKLSPFPSIFGIKPRVRYTEEFLEKLLIMATEVPYSKAAQFGTMFTNSKVNSKSLWKKAQEYGQMAEEKITKQTTESEVGISDSTKVKAGNKDTHKRGLDAHIVIACKKGKDENGRKTIKKDLIAFTVSSGYKKLKSQLKKSKAELNLIIMDGERGAKKMFKGIWNWIDFQRCIWHLFYQMGYFLWKDGIKKSERSLWIEKLKQIVYAPKGYAVKELQKKYRNLTKELEVLGLRYTSSYLANASPDVFTFRKKTRKVKTGRWIAQSVIERLMREINRRSDIGRRWTHNGADNLLRLRLLKMLHFNIFTSLFKNNISSHPSTCFVTLVEKAPINTCY